MWFDPKDTSDVGPSAHVGAVNQDDVVIGRVKEVPCLVVGGSHVGVEDVDWLSLVDVWKLPGLFEVLGSLVQVKVITVGVGEARSFDWSIRSDCLSAPLIIIDNFHGMNVLAVIAIPEWVLTVLLPPFSIEVREMSLESWFWFWAS